MNLRPFTIVVSAIANHRFATHADVSDAPQGRYVINLDTAQLSHLFVPAYAALAHEIGHVIGHEFGFPQHRTYEEKPWHYESLLGREREAWDFAEAIFSVRHARIPAIMSYERGKSMDEIVRELKATETNINEKE